MAILDPIRPYLAVIRVALWCLLAAAIFIGGCQRGKSSQQAETAKVQAQFAAYQAKMVEATRQVAQAAALAKVQYDLKAAEAIRSYEDGRKSAELHEATLVADLRSGNVRLRDQWKRCLSAPKGEPATGSAGASEEPPGVSPEDFSAIVRIGDDADQEVKLLQAMLKATRDAYDSCANTKSPW